jgi:hypothetical protein
MPLRRIAYLLSALCVAVACAPAGPASISSFSPTTGPTGITITVVGANLSDVSAAAIGGVNAQVVDVTASRVVLKVPDDAVTGQITLSGGGTTVTSRLRFVVAAGKANTEPTPGPPAVSTNTGYSLLSVPTAYGTFVVHLIKERLSEVNVKTVAANTVVCRSDCPAKPLAQYAAENNAYAGMNGTYLCPPDYVECAGKVNSYEYAVYDSNLRTWLNLPSLATTQTGLVTFTGGTPTFYRRSNVYARERLSLALITAGLSMYPLLLQGGRVVNSDGEQSDAQKLRSMKGSIGADASFLYLALVANASVTESAHVLQALGVRDALNLDGGGTSAMWIGSYKVGPGRLLPNAILLTRP